MSAPAAAPVPVPVAAPAAKPSVGDVVALVAIQMALSFAGATILALLGNTTPEGFTAVGIFVGAQAWAGMKEKRAPGTLAAPFRARLALLAAVVHVVVGTGALAIFAAVMGGATATIFFIAIVLGGALAYGFTRLGLRLGTPKALR